MSKVKVLLSLKQTRLTISYDTKEYISIELKATTSHTGLWFLYVEEGYFAILFLRNCNRHCVAKHNVLECKNVGGLNCERKRFKNDNNRCYCCHDNVKNHYTTQRAKQKGVSACIRL